MGHAYGFLVHMEPRKNYVLNTPSDCHNASAHLMSAKLGGLSVFNIQKGGATDPYLVDLQPKVENRKVRRYLCGGKEQQES